MTIINALRIYNTHSNIIDSVSAIDIFFLITILGFTFICAAIITAYINE
jgi:hypothetical protein